ncbi:MAG: hypothetical protein K8R41_13365 [Bacteroidales bacterium]|nr:hypothetical protein [Bacteroidales bacterium]
MEIDKIYSLKEIEKHGLTPNPVANVDYSVFKKEEKIYFFEQNNNKNLRLFSVINKQSFFL